MSDLSLLMQQVANLTERMNQITLNAKKIPELNPQIVLDPISLIHVSRGGVSEYLSIQQIISQVLEFKYNRLISVSGPITVLGNDITVPPAVWIMDNINYETIANTVINIPYAQTGYTRTDIIVGDKFNVIKKIIGTETEGISPTPNTPIDTVFITSIDVTDSSIGSPATPLLQNTPYRSKVLLTSNPQIITFPANVIITTVNYNGQPLDFYYWDISSGQITINYPDFNPNGQDQISISGIQQI